MTRCFKILSLVFFQIIDDFKLVCCWTEVYEAKYQFSILYIIFLLIMYIYVTIIRFYYRF